MQNDVKKQTLDRSVPPALHDYPDVTFEVPQWQVLANGIRLCVVDHGDVDVCKIDVYVGGGLLEQTKRYVPMLLCHMLAKGTLHHTSDEIAEQLDFYGAKMSASVSDHCCQATLRCANDNLEHLMPIFNEMLTCPIFPQNELDKLVDRIVAYAAISAQRVSVMADTCLSQMYYGKESLLAGEYDAEGARLVTTDDLRDFFNQHFAPGNCRVVVSGRVTEKVITEVRHCVERWQNRTFSDLKPWHREPQEVGVQIVDKPDAMQTGVAIAIDAIGRSHPDYITLRILITALGGYFGSRLMSNIREDKGYTYGIQSYLIGRGEDGYIGISTECATQYTQNVLTEIRYEMKRMREELIGEDELQMVRNHMLTDLMKTFDTAFAMAGYVGSTICYGVSPDYFNEQYKLVKSVTPEQLRAVAQRYLLEENMRIALAGDAKALAEVS